VITERRKTVVTYKIKHLEKVLVFYFTRNHLKNVSQMSYDKTYIHKPVVDMVRSLVAEKVLIFVQKGT